MSVPVLTYFDFRGLGEPIRLMLADLGLAFDDHRVGGAEWDALKPQMQFRQMPRWRDGEATLFQCQAILRHLARTHRLCGDTEAEAVRCDISIEAGRDTQMRLWDHFWAPGSDAAEAAAEFEAETLAHQLGLMSAWLGDAPWFGGERLLFCDYYVVTALDEAAGFFPRGLAAEPSLANYRRRFYARPGIAAYVASGRQPAGYGFDPIRGVRTPKP